MVRIDELILDVDNRTPIEVVVMGSGRGYIELGNVTIHADTQELDKLSIAIEGALRKAGFKE